MSELTIEMGWVSTGTRGGFDARFIIAADVYLTPVSAARECVRELANQGLKDVSEVWVGRLTASSIPSDDPDRADVVFTVSGIRSVVGR